MTPFQVSAANLVESSPHEFCACASDLGITVAMLASTGWPAYIVVPGLGNGMHFVPVSRCTRDGDLLHVRYRQSMGCAELKIFND